MLTNIYIYIFFSNATTCPLRLLGLPASHEDQCAFVVIHFMSSSFKYLGSMLTNDGRCTCEIKSRIAMAKAAFSKKKTLFTSKLDLKFEEETNEMLHLEHGFLWC